VSSYLSPILARSDFIEFDASGNLYVTDFMTGVIRRISPTGQDLGNVASGLAGPGFQGPEGIAFDTSGNLDAAIYNTIRVERYSSAGGSLGTFASVSTGSYGIAFDRGGSLYIADYFAGAIRKFSSTGVDLGVFASGLVNPRDLVIVELCGDSLDFSGTQYTECFREVRRSGDINSALCANVSETPDPARITVCRGRRGKSPSDDDEGEEGQRPAAAAAAGRPRDDHAGG
jgi:hypothetical protein